jgi:putative membrane protein
MSLRIFLTLAAASAMTFAQAPANSPNPQAPAKGGNPQQPATKNTNPKSSSEGTMSNADRKFLEEALQGNRAEVSLGHIAAQRAMDPQVKSFGEMMVKDHTQGVQEIESLARMLNVSLPTEKQDPAQAKLEKLNGAAFDKAYMSDMLKDHKKDVAEFKKESTSASNTQVRDLAAKMLPTLQMHLDKATMINDQMNKKGTADRSTK